MALVESQSPACPDVGARSRQSPRHGSGIWVTQGGMMAPIGPPSPCRHGCGPSSGCCIKLVKEDGVPNVHTLVFGSGRTGAELGRIPYVSAGD
jgi:hypothetical protein